MENWRNLRFNFNCFIIIGLVSYAASVKADHCGSGIASKDLSGNCRVFPATMGALEVFLFNGPLGKGPVPRIVIQQGFK